MKRTAATVTTCPKCGKSWEGRWHYKERVCPFCGKAFKFTKTGGKP